MKAINQISIFLASPGDVDIERQVVEEIIEELNLTWAKPNNYSINLENWEKSSYPAIGEDAQEVINRQLDFNFDIFICIFWKRIGTKTKRAESGSIEELEIALKKHKKGDNIEIMAYFKDEPIPPSEFTEQVIKVNLLRERFKSLGLYHTFSSSDHFKKMFRISLTNCLNNKFLLKNQKNSANESSLEKQESYKEKLEIINKISNITIDESDYEEGIIETYELLNDKSERLTFILEDLTGTINLMSENLNRRTEEIDHVNNIKDHKLRLKKANIIINRSAEDMDNVSSKLDSEFENFQDGFTDIINSFSIVYEGFNYEKDSEERQVLDELILSIEGAINGLGSMFLAVNDLPKMNSKIGITKSRLLKSLKAYIDELNFGRNLLVEIGK